MLIGHFDYKFPRHGVEETRGDQLDTTRFELDLTGE